MQNNPPLSNQPPESETQTDPIPPHSSSTLQVNNAGKTVSTRRRLPYSCLAGIIIAALMGLLILCIGIVFLSGLIPGFSLAAAAPTPTATLTPSPQHTATAIPTFTPTANNSFEEEDLSQPCANAVPIPAFQELTPLFCDSFDADNGWWAETTSDEFATANRYLSNSQLRWDVTPRQAYHSYSLSPNGDDLDTFALQARMLRLSDQSNLQAGILMRINYEERTHYYLAINDAFQTYSFYLFDDNIWTAIREATFSDAIIPNDWNQVAVYGYGEWFDLYINGQYIESLQDSTLQAGEFGLGADFFSVGISSTIAFDDFILFAP